MRKSGWEGATEPVESQSKASQKHAKTNGPETARLGPLIQGWAWLGRPTTKKCTEEEGEGERERDEDLSKEGVQEEEERRRSKRWKWKWEWEWSGRRRVRKGKRDSGVGEWEGTQRALGGGVGFSAAAVRRPKTSTSLAVSG